MSIHKKIANFNNLNQKVTNLNILQDFMDTISKTSSVEEKIEQINNIIIERYQIKYSTIVVYDGTKYIVRASNVDQKHWEALSDLQSEEIFKESIQTSIPKYVTVEAEGERLPYQKMEFARAKCAMFFPLYIDNVYIGYWLLEGNQPHEFDTVDTTMLEVIRNNIVAILKTVQNQKIIESIVRNDKYSTLKTAEYLYGEGRKTIDQYTTSTVCMFRITNLEEINEDISRKTGDTIITKVCEIIKTNLSNEYIFVRYMGPKFVIVFSGIERSAVISFVEQIKQEVEEIEVEPVDVEFEDAEDIVAKPKINVIISTYYKGTALEGVLKKEEEYLDNADKNENKISEL
jgi:diguanylate cyclase (GGDEF)-like protein